jgi:hypothetical protein
MAIPSEPGETGPGSPVPDPGLPTPDPGSPEEALRRLEQRLDRASEVAERLIAQAAVEAARAAAGSVGAGGSVGGAGESAGATPPPAGWQTAEDSRESTSELDPLVALVQAMRDLVPPDLQRRLIAAVRELLMALRALIDWYLERLDGRREQGVEVQDIPIL